MKVIVCGGGTGGHIYPALAVVDELCQLGVQREDILWIGTQGQMEERLVPDAHIQLQTIQGGPVVGVPIKQQVGNLLKLAWSMVTSHKLIRQFKPHVLFLTGGYVNAPVALTARLRNLPACIYLPDVEPGTAIKQLLPFVQKVAVTTPDSEQFLPADKMVVTGYPVRASLRQAAKLSKEKALATFDLTTARKTLFVFGGSRGALTINQALMAILSELLNEIQVIHISGTYSWAEVEAFSQQLPAELKQYYRPYAYLDDEMAHAFRAADLVVARAGASMLGECPAFGLPAILVPYPFAWRYQKVNADYLVTRGAALRLDDEKMSTQLLPTIRTLMDDPQRLGEMAQVAQALDKPDAAKKIAQLLISMERDGHG